MPGRLQSALALGIVLLLVFGSGSVLAGGAPQASGSLSGYEFFPGLRLPFTSIRTTHGTSFGGWTHGAAPAWQPFALRSGGYWVATITYRGRTGPGRLVPITGGSWVLHHPGGGVDTGKVVRGSVIWPATLADDLGCGKGVAVIDATLGTFRRSTPAGTLTGCLDDTHLGERFPPRVWASLTLMRADQDDGRGGLASRLASSVDQVVDAASSLFSWFNNSVLRVAPQR